MLHISGVVSIAAALRTEVVQHHLPVIPTTVKFVDPGFVCTADVRNALEEEEQERYIEPVPGAAGAGAGAGAGADADSKAPEPRVEVPEPTVVSFGCTHIITAGVITTTMDREVAAVLLADGSPLDVKTAGVPSGFGNLRTMTTDFDPAIRRARELLPSEVRVAKEDYFRVPIVQQLRQTLFRHMPVALELKKVNIYGPGDHFARHVDTPVPGVLGTVVVVVLDDRCRVSRSFEGGALVLRPRGLEPFSACDGSERYGSREQVVQYRFAAFYSDIVHEITPVVSGYRVGLVYNIVRGDSGSDMKVHEDKLYRICGARAVKEWTRPNTDPVAEVRRVLDVGEGLAAYDNIGVLCASRYSYDEIDAGAAKGVDADVLRELESWGYSSVTIVPVLVSSAHKYTPSVSDFSIKFYRMTREDLTRALLLGAPDTVTTKYVFVCPGATQAEHVWTSLEEYVEHTGNQCRPGEMDLRYWSSAILASRPPQVLTSAPAPAPDADDSSGGEACGGMDGEDNDTDADTDAGVVDDADDGGDAGDADDSDG
jgi:hypothetical protein